MVVSRPVGMECFVVIRIIWTLSTKESLFTLRKLSYLYLCLRLKLFHPQLVYLSDGLIPSIHHEEFIRIDFTNCYFLHAR